MLGIPKVTKASEFYQDISPLHAVGHLGPPHTLSSALVPANTADLHRDEQFSKLLAKLNKCSLGESNLCPIRQK